MKASRLMNRYLDSKKTIATINKLKQRINERFTDSGLYKVAVELEDIAKETDEKLKWIAKPNYLLRITLAFIIGLILLVLLYSISIMNISLKIISLAELIQVIEAVLNDIILISAAIFFLLSLEQRIKRTRALAALDELRALAHVIDMHQLTKDPSRAFNYRRTKSSPKETLTSYELTRYLDYCSEMLSLTSKVAALFAQHFNDALVLSTVNDLENLTTGLSRKIWQKLMIIHRLQDDVVLSETLTPEKDGQNPS